MTRKLDDVQALPEHEAQRLLAAATVTPADAQGPA
jgi:hypothetical protein